MAKKVKNTKDNTKPDYTSMGITFDSKNNNRNLFIEDWSKERNEILKNNIRDTGITKLTLDNQLKNIIDTDVTNDLDWPWKGGTYSRNKNEVNINPLHKNRKETALIHEQTHAMFPKPQENKIKQLQNINPQKDRFLMNNYYNHPAEIYARTMQFRKDNKLQPNNTVQLEHIENFRKNKTLKKYNLDSYDNSFLYEVFNGTMKQGGYLPTDYGLGSWLKEGDTGMQMGAGMATGAASGALAGSVVPGIGTAVGAVVGGASGLISGLVKGRGQAKQENAQLNTDLIAVNDIIMQNKLNQYGANTQQYMPTMGAGGHLPEGKATLKDAKQFMKLYPQEMMMGEEVEYEHTGNKKLAQRIAADHIKDHLQMTGGDPSYYTKLKEAGISDELNKMGYGGKIKPEKAQEILKHGKINDKNLTDRQKKYFGYIANRAMGGDITDPNRQTNNLVNAPAVYEKGVKNVMKAFWNSPLPKDANRKAIQQNYNKVKDIYNPTATGPSMADSVYSNRLDKIVPRNIPSREVINTYPNLSKVVDKAENAPPEVVMSLLNRDYNDKLKVKDIFSLMGDANKIGVGPIEALKAYNEANKLGEQGYTFSHGGSINKDAYSISGSITDSVSYNEQSPVTVYQGGGTHEQNSLGGIPIGQKARVEANEVKVKLNDGDYIFSDRY